MTSVDVLPHGPPRTEVQTERRLLHQDTGLVESEYLTGDYHGADASQLAVRRETNACIPEVELVVPPNTPIPGMGNLLATFQVLTVADFFFKKDSLYVTLVVFLGCPTPSGRS